MLRYKQPPRMGTFPYMNSYINTLYDKYKHLKIYINNISQKLVLIIF